MSKPCCVAFVFLAVICLQLSFEADARTTVDKTNAFKRDVQPSKDALVSALECEYVYGHFVPVTGATFCDECVCLWVCLSVCLSVHSHNTNTTQPKFTKFSCIARFSVLL